MNFFDVTFAGPEVDLGAFSLTAAGKNNPLFELAADLGLKSVSLGELQLLIPWEKRVVIGTDLDTVFSETSKVINVICELYLDYKEFLNFMGFG